MLAQLIELYKLLSPTQRLKLYLLQILLICMSILEVISLGALGSFIALIGNVETLTQNFLYQYFLDYSIAPVNEESFLIMYSVIVLTLVVLSSLMSIFVLWRLTIFGSLVGADLSNRLFNYYLHQPWLFHVSRNSSELINKISNEANRVTNSVISQYMMLNGKLVMSIIISFALFVFNPVIAILGTTIFISGYFSVYKLAQGRLERNSNTLTDSMKLRFKLMGEGFGGIRDTLLLGKQTLFSSRFQKASNDYFYALATSSIIGLIPRYFMELLAFCSVVSLVLYLLIAYSGDSTSILPIISIYAVAGFKLIPAFQQVYFSITVIRANLSSFSSLKDDLTFAPLIDSQNENSSSKNSKLRVQNHINLENISFKFDGKPHEVLSKINISIPAKKVIGIIGSSGSGKSTLVDILVGLITPLEGCVKIDDIILNDSLLRDWQNNIGFVSQSIFLSDSTIRENIAFGLPVSSIDESSIKLVSRLAHLESFLDELPKGLDTLVGERGVQLSGGQRQRIGIARALYNDVDVLVFDEATSSLDGVTENLVMEAIHNLSGHKTIILVAHRLSTVKKCDNIFLMHEGQIVDQGTYKDLEANSKIFQEMSKTS